MKKDRLFSVLLLTLLLTTACGAEAAVPSESSADTVPAATEAETEEGLKPFIEAQDYQGKSFHILAESAKTDLYFSDGETGDVMNDAVYQRNRQTEEYLNVAITYDNQHAISDIAATLKKNVAAGDDAYQFVLTHVMQDVAACVSQNLLYDWNTIKSVDFSRPYWNESIVRELELYDHVFYVRSTYMVPNPLVMYFNKTMIADYDLENPYDLVRNGKWTLDKLIELASAVSRDENGDGKMDEKDAYGYVTMVDWQLTGFLYASGLTVCGHDGNDIAMNLNNEKTVDLCQRIWDMVHAGYAFRYNYCSLDQAPIDIPSGRVLFTNTNLSVMKSNYRDSTVDIGILPYPKYDEAQETYLQYDLAGHMAMPSTVSDPEMAGQVVEMLSYFSMSTTIPAYYDVLFGSKLLRDEDSAEMLDIIFDNIVYDAGMNYFGLGTNYGYQLVYVVPNICKTNSGDFASFYKKNEKGFQKEINKFMEAVRSYEG